MRIQPHPFRVQKFLAGIRYPARKGEVVERARLGGADAELLDVLTLLPEREYDSPISVSCEIGRQIEQTRN